MEEQRDGLIGQINASVAQSEASVEKEMRIQITKMNENLAESMKQMKTNIKNKQDEQQQHSQRNFQEKLQKDREKLTQRIK